MIVYEDTVGLRYRFPELLLRYRDDKMNQNILIDFQSTSANQYYKKLVATTVFSLKGYLFQISVRHNLVCVVNNIFFYIFVLLRGKKAKITTICAHFRHKYAASTPSLTK